jgi:predicted GIY-YIG superfamily endonuclease
MITFTIMNEVVKDALRAEKAMNKALKREKASHTEKKQPRTPKVNVVAEKI